MRISDWSSDVCSSDLIRCIRCQIDFLWLAEEFRFGIEQEQIKDRFHAREDFAWRIARAIAAIGGCRRDVDDDLEPELATEKHGAIAVIALRDDRELQQTKYRLRTADRIKSAKDGEIHRDRDVRNEIGRERWR